MGRPLETLLAAFGLFVVSPLMVVAAVGIRLASPGRVLYRAPRVGLNGRVFTMLKFRTMAEGETSSGRTRVTKAADSRIFRFGRLLRITKIDELPQLLNVLRGEMSLVGPRPEHPDFVKRYADPVHLETLSVRPGLVSPGSLYNYTHIESEVVGEDAESVYLSRFLPVKLALDCVYVRRRSTFYDFSIIIRTIGVILSKLLGRERFDLPPEMPSAESLIREVES